ncbi:MAG TPA: hypothetical protein VF719_00260, partial [Abditibacteriaceae bacterium]
MHDLKLIRTNPELLKQHLANKQIADGATLVDEVIALDERRRANLVEVEAMKKERNEASQQVAKRRKAGEDAGDIIEQTRTLGEKISSLDSENREVE